MRFVAVITLAILALVGGQSRAWGKVCVSEKIASGVFAAKYDGGALVDEAASLEYAGRDGRCGYELASGQSKWLSRDPSGESSGPNLYRVLNNDVLGQFDFLGLRGAGHHLVPWSLFNGKVSEAVQAFFDSDLARIWREGYDFHDGSSIAGISHSAYNDAVKAELEAFLGSSKIEKMTIEQAQEFVGLLKSSSDRSIIGLFNSGIMAEASAAAEAAKAGLSKKLREAAVKAMRSAWAKMRSQGQFW